MKNKEPLVYISILNWNGLDETLECLQSLRDLDYKNFKIIVIDNNSEKDEASIIKEKFNEVYIIQNEKNEWFRAHNQSIEYAMKQDADYVLLFNNDAIGKKGFLKRMIEYMEENKKVGICGPVIKYYKSDKVWFGGSKFTPFGIPRQQWKGKLYEEFKESVKAPKDIAFMTGCAMLIRSEVISKIGGLDPIYYAYVEDVDYCERCRKAGFEVKLIPDSVIEHRKSAAAGDEGSSRFGLRQTYLISRNDVIFARKNLSGFRRVKYLFIGVLIIRLLYLLVYSKNLKARWGYFKGVCEGLKTDLTKEYNWYPPKE